MMKTVLLSPFQAVCLKLATSTVCDSPFIFYRFVFQIMMHLLACMLDIIKQGACQ